MVSWQLLYSSTNQHREPETSYSHVTMFGDLQCHTGDISSATDFGQLQCYRFG
ncbi:uncharacterized protein CLUP02_11246 [Colletotrichum lupini]|uniref:Uncharacterized protein n=1 Tax=Colletotrichum lupini TaxID=145971 RepID=A0A9Q8WK44_9PEZI|nr:uncharacterized protein CLUP02_11246 [Colletotrichum lupini]UQC85747.1 hypothetical protein CLUP02_11246 [Colletotrichum lupini]